MYYVWTRQRLETHQDASRGLRADRALAWLQGECSGEEADPTKYATWLASRPPSMEYDAIELLIRLLEEDKTPAAPGFTLHIAHLANADVLPMIQAAKKKGALQ